MDDGASRRRRAVWSGALSLVVGGAGCGARTGLEAPFGEEPPKSVEVNRPDQPDEPPEPPELQPLQPAGCENPDAAFVYAITSDAEMMKYDPANRTFEILGPMICPSFGGSPFSMAVSKEAIAYVVYTNGRLMRFDLAELSCEATSWEPRIEGEPYHVYGMGYAADPTAANGERMYVADIDFDFGATSAGLAYIDDETFALNEVGPFSLNPSGVIELTGSGIEGDPWGYFLNEDSGDGTLVALDRNTAKVTEAIVLEPGGFGSLAIAWWGEDFYVFKGSGQSTEITRYDPDTGTASFDATLPGLVVGASASTCAAIEAVEP